MQLSQRGLQCQEERLFAHRKLPIFAIFQRLERTELALSNTVGSRNDDVAIGCALSRGHSYSSSTITIAFVSRSSCLGFVVESKQKGLGLLFCELLPSRASVDAARRSTFLDMTVHQ